MNTLIIACRMIENEFNYAYSITGHHESVMWLESGLHNVKEQLRDAIQNILDTESAYDRILLAASFCGNSLIGLETRNAELIIPRTDDCISLLFGGTENKLQWIDSYFLTEGWLKNTRSLPGEYHRSIKKYGEKRSFRIFQAMLSGYQRFLLLDTGCYDLSASIEQTQELANIFSKKLETVPVNTSYIEELLNGPWPEERFLIVPPNTKILPENLHLNI